MLVELNCGHFLLCTGTNGVIFASEKIKVLEKAAMRAAGKKIV